MKKIRKSIFFVFTLSTLVITTMLITSGIAPAMSERAPQGRYMHAVFYDASQPLYYYIDVGDYRYFDGVTMVVNHYIHLKTYTVPGGDPTWEEWIRPDAYEDTEFKFNFGKNPSFEGEINGDSLSIVFSSDNKLEAFNYPSPSYKRHIQLAKQGSASVTYTGWPGVAPPVDGWWCGLTWTLAVVPE